MATAAVAAQRFKLIIFVPTTHLEPVKRAIFAAGAGHYPPPPTAPKYTECCFVTLGTGSFRPAADATPFLGTAGSAAAEEVAEARLETICHGEDMVTRAVAAMKTYVREERETWGDVSLLLLFWFVVMCGGTLTLLIRLRAHPYEEVAYDVLRLENF